MEVVGVGALVVDHLLHIDDAYLETIPGEKWGMELVSYPEVIEIIEKSGTVPKQVTGGSCANAIKGLASLGHPCAFASKIGNDPIGEFVLEDLQNLQITPYFTFSETPTGHIACLITPDGKRTLRSYVGASGEMTPENLQPPFFEGAKLVHIEAYTLLYPGVTLRAMELARQAGAKVSFDLGSFEVVNTHHSLILDLLQEYVDIVFANANETHALVENGPEKGCELMSELCEIAIVMLAEKGSIVGHNGKTMACPAFPVKPIDTTGAGDLFASGFLHGYLKGKALEECARYGAIVGGTVVQVVGAEIPEERWREVRERLF